MEADTMVTSDVRGSVQTSGHVILASEGEANDEVRKPCIRFRYVTAILASFGFIMAQGTRTSLNIALIAMVNYTAETPINQSQAQCPQSHDQHNRTTPEKQGQFDWDGAIQSQLLSSFYYGYIVTQLPGGYLAERVGSTWVMGLTVCVPGILSLLHPLLAHWDYRALLAARVLMGMCQGPLYPANQAMWGRWAPPLERSRLMTVSCSGAFIGILTSLMLTGYLCDLPYLGGWPLPFYFWGGTSCLWFIVWKLIATDKPSQSKLISSTELEYIEICTGYIDTKPYVRPPWCRILTSRPLWAVIFYLICDGIGYFVMFSGLPVYLKQVLGFDVSMEGLLTALPPLASVVVSLLVSPLADFILSKRWLSTTAVRKIFTLIGECSMVLALIAVGLADCNYVLIVSFFIIGYGLNGFTSSGIGIVTLDMAPQYAGTLLGMTNLVNSCGGFLAPAFVNLITDNQGDKDRWKLVFFLTSGCYLLGLIVFTLFGSAEVQPWAVIAADPSSPRREGADSHTDPEDSRSLDIPDTRPLIS